MHSLISRLLARYSDKFLSRWVTLLFDIGLALWGLYFNGVYPLQFCAY